MTDPSLPSLRDGHAVLSPSHDAMASAACCLLPFGACRLDLLRSQCLSSGSTVMSLYWFLHVQAGCCVRKPPEIILM